MKSQDKEFSKFSVLFRGGNQEWPLKFCDFFYAVV